MRTTMLAVVACAALSLSAGLIAYAEEPPGGAPPQSATYAPPAAPANQNDEVICKNVPQLGSRLQTNRVCMTKADWEIQQKRDQQTTQEWQRHGAPQQGH
jgi:hypothetical protein